MINKLYNFGAGPAMLPHEVKEATAQAVIDYNHTGLSLIEIGHRTSMFKDILNEAQTLMKELLNIPDGYSVLFLGGGARLQFSMIPMNFMHYKAAYLDSGHWANEAMHAAEQYGETICVASSADDNYTYIPHQYAIPNDADYLHITTNNTIYGTELKNDISSPIPLIADMSSDILTRKVDVKKYDVIYGGAQKNLSMAGVTFVIVKNEAAQRNSTLGRIIPPMLDYVNHIKAHSLYNTPPVLAIYTALQTLRWVKAQGGVEVMHGRAMKRANLLYDEIERNKLFHATAHEADRSLMNICFVLNEGYKHLEDAFVEFSLQHGIYAIRGHRSVGGFRASCYNAMPIEGVEQLVRCMQDFEKTF